MRFMHYLNYFLILIITIGLLERKFPLRNYKFFSNHYREDVLWFLLNYIAMPTLIYSLPIDWNSLPSRILPGYADAFDLSKLSLFFQGMLYLLIIDFSTYWIHRLFHSYKPLWKMHRLHHSTTELTSLSSFRFSWLEFVIHQTLLAISTCIFYFHASIGFKLISVFPIVCFIQHSNIKIRFSNFFNYLIITPKNHFWHHSDILYKKNGQNFGLIFPWWDMIFKTYYNPDHYQSELGLSDSFKYRNFFNKFFYPVDTIIISYWKKMRNK